MTPQVGSVVVAEVGPDDAATVLAVIHAAFGARAQLDPPSTAMEETVESVAAALTGGGGLLATQAGEAVGALLLEPVGDSLLLRRVSVRPDRQHHGVAHALCAAVDDVARRRGFARTHLTARLELPATVRFWMQDNYREVARQGTSLTLAKELPVDCEVPDAGTMRSLGERLSAFLRPGDLLVLTGELGAGKTTLVQGIGSGLGVRGDITSPTFVISRIHPAPGNRPPLVHVDAYRLGGLAELDDLDLDVSVEDSVTVVEWGEGLVEGLAENRLEVRITRTTGHREDATERRTVRLTPVGARWVGSGIAGVVA